MANHASRFTSILDRGAGRIVRLTAFAAATSLLAACGTAPLSYVNDRQVYFKAELNRYPVYVVSVDGTSSTFRPLPITAGEHTLALDAQPVAGFSQPLRKVYPISIAPCTRYYIAAQRTSPLTQDWDLIVEKTFPVAGCDPDKELEKARQAAAQGKQPPLSSAIESASPTAVALNPSPPAEVR